MSDPSEVVRVKLEIPHLQTEVELDLNLDETVWNLKNNIVKTIASELQEFPNYGLYIPSTSTKAAKYLDEERTLREYNLSPETSLQLISKKRIYRAVILNTKKLREINKKLSRKKLIRYIEQGNSKKVRELLEKGLDPNFIDSDSEECPLTLSVSSMAYVEVITHLVGAGAHLDYRNKQGWTAMHKAARNGHLGAIKILLNFGASPNYRDLNGLSPLYISVCHDTPAECIKELLKNYALLGLSDKEGNSELHQACKNGRVQHLDLLITYGADLDSVNLNGNTPLHICAMKNYEECARLLLFRGANKYVKNNLNQEPLELAKFYKNHKLEDIIISHTAQDVVLSNETPTYNEKSRLTLKGRDCKSLLFSKMNKLSLSTPYLHQSVSNFHLESKITNDCSSVKSNNSENHSTGSADQQFEFDVIPAHNHDSRLSSMSNGISQNLTKLLREKYTTMKTRPSKVSSVLMDFHKSNVFFKRQYSSDLFKQSSPIHLQEVPTRRQSYDCILDAPADDIYMNEWEIEREQSNSKTVNKWADNMSKSDEHRLVALNKPSNPFNDLILTSRNKNPMIKTFQDEVHSNYTDNPCYDLKMNFQTMEYKSSIDTNFPVSIKESTPHVQKATSPSKPESHMPNLRVDISSKITRNVLSSDKKAITNKNLENGTLPEFQKQMAKSSKEPTFAFIPPPPIFPSSLKKSNGSKILRSPDNPSISPPLPPPPLDNISNSDINSPLPPPPTSYHTFKASADDDAKVELMTAIIKRRKKLEQL